MPAAEQDVSAEPISLEMAKVVHLDHEIANRSLLEDTLRKIGFQEITACEDVGRFAETLQTVKPDLVFVDIDAESERAFGTIRAIRSGKVGDSPFVVIVALTQRPELEIVQAALEAGSDDMVIKPVTAKALRQRVVNQIENRKEFIATDDYVGPDRRADTRELTEDDVAAIRVPNSLRHAATGDESAAPTEERIKETLRNLSIQKFYHLSAKIAVTAERQRDLAADSTKSVDCASAMQDIAETLAEIDVIIGEQAFQSVAQVVASTRQTLDEVKACGGKATPRHLELLHVHGGSIGVVLKESDESAGVLVSALEKAVSVVKAGPCEPKQEAADGVSQPPSAADAAVRKDRTGGKQFQAPPAPEPQRAPAALRTDIPLRVRLKAWWNGVDPLDMMADAAK